MLRVKGGNRWQISRCDQANSELASSDWGGAAKMSSALQNRN